MHEVTSVLPIYLPHSSLANLVLTIQYAGCDAGGGSIQLTTNRHSYFNLVTNTVAVKCVLLRWQTMNQNWE
jgi:hypothetical protein